jgi:large subunit ribosomal protein L17
MITLGRRGDIHARRQAVAYLGSKDIVHKLFSDLGPRFAERPGGYLRIVRLGPRQGDAAEMVYLELVDTPLVFKTKLEDVEGPVPGLSTGERFQPQAEEGEEPEADAEAEGEEPEAEAEVAEAEPEGEEAEEAEEPEAEAGPAEEPEPEADEPAAEADSAEPEAEAKTPADES